ncbi:MAG: hypothetical protein ACYDBJ_23840 [Aggregatilineales bacterium]
MNFVDLWGWLAEVRQRARQQGDAERTRLVSLYDRAWDICETDPNAALSLLTEGRALAEQLREPCLMLFFDYWRCEIYLYKLRDVANGLDLSVRASVEAQKPMYRTCAVRSRVYLTLAVAYGMIDPLGYADEITRTLDYLEKEVPLDKDTWQRIESERAALAYTQNRLNDCERLTMSYMSYIARCESNNFRLTDAYGRLCILSYKRQKLDKALEYARLGEEAARKANLRLASLTFLAWQALLQRKLGNELEASRIYQTTMTNLQWFKSVPSSRHYYVLCEYHDDRAEYALALKLRRQQLEQLGNSGSANDEAWARYYVCRYLVKMRSPVRAELALARAAAHKLKDPAPLAKKLDALELESFGGCVPLLFLSRWFAFVQNPKKS